MLYIDFGNILLYHVVRRYIKIDIIIIIINIVYNLLYNIVCYIIYSLSG